MIKIKICETSRIIFGSLLLELEYFMYGQPLSNTVSTLGTR